MARLAVGEKMLDFTAAGAFGPEEALSSRVGKGKTAIVFLRQMEAAGPISLPLPAFSITRFFLTAITEDRKKSGTRPDLCFFRGLSSWEQPVLTVQSMPLL